MSEIDTLGIILQNIKTKHMARDMWGDITECERDAYREQCSVILRAIEVFQEREIIASIKEDMFF